MKQLILQWIQQSTDYDEIYIKLAKQCMVNDPMKRPTAKEVHEQLQEWEIILNNEKEDLNEEKLK